jgi:AcrR family transcriptional regulator
MPYPSKTSPDAVVQAALELLETHGHAALSMRLLAQALDLKAPSLYRHFRDKDALEAAMVAEGAKRLLQRLQEAVQERGSQRELTAVATAYLTFAHDYPELYALLMRRLQPPTPKTPAKNLWNFLLEVVSELTQQPDDTAAAVALWSFLHGYASLEHSGMFGDSGPRGALTLGLRALQHGLRSGSS